MNNFVQIKKVAQYDKVSYYSVTINSETTSLFEQFIATHTANNKEKLNHILAWLQEIGIKYGAQTYLFRPEAYLSDTSALPPTGKDKEPTYIENGETESNNLRLYCFRLNENVVVLYSGDLKTADKAQDCINVKSHFLLANKLTRALENSIKENEVYWNEDCTDIIFDSDLEIAY
ncbi:hypothetical protein PBAC_26170 [Pedobacter glucosidilyticus]|uniref:Uncharacterized protein n=1 Tax=Pedobacter aquae TaxID=2605747 RepID=A0A5C0VGU7_9SPHI|nr:MULTISPECIES: hypothetical protein [Pedobacter]KHJ37174.1 hypothetical protein PBAC_26170 [Pedobacter glucosidilyticus]QEK51122.1 hypothetical protein FYC62_05110 [Pedobacter aquae]